MRCTVLVSYLFIGRRAFVIGIGYVILAENLLTGVTSHGKKICNIRVRFQISGSKTNNTNKQDGILCLLLSSPKRLQVFSEQCSPKSGNSITETRQISTSCRRKEESKGSELTGKMLTGSTVGQG